MTNELQLQDSGHQDRFGRKIAARLSAGSTELPYEVSERLRAARMQALSRRKVQARTAATTVTSAGTAALTFGDEGLNLWSRLASALPLIALVAGLVAINVMQNENRAREVAEVDAALLTDDLPPSAYADSGFMQFLKTSGGNTP